MSIHECVCVCGCVCVWVGGWEGRRTFYSAGMMMTILLMYKEGITQDGSEEALGAQPPNFYTHERLSHVHTSGWNPSL